MLLEFQQLDFIEIKIENEILKSSNEYDFFSCNCNHIHGGIDHGDLSEYSTAPCQFGMRNIICGCTRFIPKKFNLVVNISLIDIFCFENQELIYDSLEFWLEYKNWIENYESTN